jgi:SAM-dependent methyltransferase
MLDIGCGNGRHMGEAIRLKGVSIIGADINMNDLLEAKKRLDDLEKLGFSRGLWGFNVAEITRLPFRDHSFDAVICSEVLEHIVEEKIAVSEISRILKPGRFLALSVPRYLPERICWKLSPEYRNTQKGHIRIYTKRRLKTIMRDSGLLLYGSHYAHSLHTPYWWLKCLVGPSINDNTWVNLYHRFLTWDIMAKPRITQWMEKILNPLLGKSIVLYLKKPNLKI